MADKRGASNATIGADSALGPTDETGLTFSTKAIDDNDSSSDETNKKPAAKRNGDSNSDHLESEESEESKASESSDPGDKAEGNEGDKKQN